MMPSVKFSITVVWNLLNCCNIFSCLDIKHYYDLRRWKFLLSCATNCRYLSSVFCVQNFKYGYLGNLQNYYCDSLCIKTNCSFASTVYSHFARLYLDVCDHFNSLISHSVCHLCSALVANKVLYRPYIKAACENAYRPISVMYTQCNLTHSEFES